MSLVRYSNVIHPMHRAGMSMARTHRELQSMDPSITYYKVRKFLKDHYACHFPIKKALVPRENCYTADSSVTVAVILKRLKERNIVISASQVRRLRDKLGYQRAPTEYCHIIRDANKEKRLEFCIRMIENHEDFSQCIFTDEKTVQVGCATKHCFVKKNDYFAELRSRAKHPAKIHLWGGISMRGPTELAMFPGGIKMDSQKYCETIERCYVPFVTTIYHELTIVSRKKNPRTVEDLRKAVAAFWKTLTPAICTNYILGMQRKLHRVIENGGGHIYEGR
ncbi:hypothetical protein OSTOST_25091 [Ostertagia ostertagi]